MSDRIQLTDEEAAAAINALAEGDSCFPSGFELGYHGRLALILRAINRFREDVDADLAGTIRRSSNGNIVVLTETGWVWVGRDGDHAVSAPTSDPDQWPVIYTPEAV